MRPSFHPRLINDHFCDPGLFIPFQFQKRALLFDLGDLGPLSPKDLLKVTHVFVTHTHMDHFIGFDTLLRTCLGRDKLVSLFGPPKFFEQVEGRLAGYTWNLVHEYTEHLKLEVNEVHPDRILTRIYAGRNRFQPLEATRSEPSDSKILAEDAFSVEAELLDHRIPCLGLSLAENYHVNIIKAKLDELGLPVGPWLTRFKAAVYSRREPDSEFWVTREQKGRAVWTKKFTLGELTKAIAKISPGRKITYITDVVASPENCRKIVELAEGAEILFVEAAFLHSEKKVARRKYHLTAREAGELARQAGVKRLALFHFSPRYRNRAAELETEAHTAFQTR
jgi:ribonuclease Z